MQNVWGDQIAIFDSFGKLVTIATKDRPTPKLELRVCIDIKCKSFEACKKCAQNTWGGWEEGEQMRKNNNF